MAEGLILKAEEKREFIWELTMEHGVASDNTAVIKLKLSLCLTN
jgi:hypothetical protein